jgi:outer membrane protein OmpA-like peptidoglycan-associated protein
MSAMAMVSTNAFADDGDQAKPASEKRVSANGNYEFKPSWGIGLQYGLTFTEMENWNDYALKPSHQDFYDVHFVADHELYGEWTPVEGFRISLFAGYQSLYISDPGFSYIYGGLEPAFSVRRSFYEFAVGLGLAYGGSITDAKSDVNGHGLLVRPFVEARFYPCDIFAIYLRLAFSYYKEFGFEFPNDWDLHDANNKRSDYEDKLSYAGPNVAVGFRFGDYATPIVVVPDSDGDGVLDDIDDCKDVSGEEQFNGCPNPDTDKDGLCDSWVADNNLQDAFASVCKGQDKCVNDSEDVDGFEDEDGCPDPDNDKDGVCDPWVAANGLSDKYADVCTGSDKSADEAEDLDGFEDEDGTPDPDNDKDGVCDPWVSEKGLSEKYASVCKGMDLCANYASNVPNTYGCGDPDPDGDGFCDAWVYSANIQSYFPQCKGLDRCPNEKGTDNKGCLPRRVEVTEAAIEIHDTINFASGKAVIQKSSDGLLAEIADVFKQNPQIKKVSIEGHTDLSGNAKKNQKLSEDRANSVRDYMIRKGITVDRLRAVGYGPHKPIADNKTKKGRAKNRRVELVPFYKDEP